MLDSFSTGRGKLWALLLIAAIAALAATAAAAGTGPAGAGGLPPDPGFQGEKLGQFDRDARTGRKAPTAEQRARAAAADASVRWNAFGTPASVIRHGSYLAEGLPQDPVTAARAYLQANGDLFGLSADDVAALELVTSPSIGAGSAVLLRQRFDGLAAGRDGLVALAVRDGKIAYVSSTLTKDDTVSGATAISAADAIRIASADAGVTAGQAETARARLVAVPTPLEGVRRAWEITLVEQSGPIAFTSFVDAETGEILVRESLVDYATDNPMWLAFPNIPPLDYSSSDTRELWCWTSAAGCDRAVGNVASPLQWDVDPVTSSPTFTTRGNNARATEDWLNPSPFNLGANFATPSLTRDYTYAWANQWFAEKCNPDTTFTSSQRNDIDAASANLFAMHNRMHDWSYYLGFTEQTFNLQQSNFGRGGAENDPEHGNVQDGGIAGGPPTFSARDNANQITPADGLQPITNMYLWQPIAGAFYAPCVDGDFDMSVIGHEYTHAISNRMVAGPNAGLSGAQAGAMGESWSDLVAVEYLNEYGFAPVGGENPFAVGPYVTRDPEAGIRNYGMNRSPLNYSNVGYDFACTTNAQGLCIRLSQVHADGEIWSATNFDLRSALNARYGSGGAALQQACADGQLPVSACPGNRRWIQLVFDSYLLMASGAVSMVDARDALLAADVTRFGGANQDLLWNAFAKRGLGQGAASAGTNDVDPVPSFESPHAAEATVTFKPVGEGADEAPIVAQLFVGNYEARSNPVADTDPATPLTDTVRLVAGTYQFVARGNGRGAARFTATLVPGQIRDLPVPMPINLASSFNGATINGDGSELGNLIDDTEASNWSSTGSAVAGKQVTVRLDPTKSSHMVRRVQVSAMLRILVGQSQQSRFSALRQFQILTCEAKGAVDCSDDSDFTLSFTSPPDAFPAIAPRPRAPGLIMRSFGIPQTKATHVRLVVLTNQCTGTPDYAGEQDNDPRANTDCSTASSQALNVRAAELQVFAH